MLRSQQERVLGRHVHPFDAAHSAAQVTASGFGQQMTGVTCTVARGDPASERGDLHFGRGPLGTNCSG